MKKIITLSLLAFIFINTSAQTDTLVVDVENNKVNIVIDTTMITIETEISDDSKTTYFKINDIEISSPDTTVISLGGYSFEFNDDYAEVKKCKKEKKPSSWRKLSNWAGIDIGVNGYVTSDFDFEVADEDAFMALNWGNSRTFSINPVEWKIKLHQNYLGFLLGAGIEWNSYRLRDLNYAMEFNADSTYGVTPTNTGVDKSKFRVTYINAPFMLEYNSSKYRKNSFHIAAGVVVGWRIDTMYKQRYRNDGKHKDITTGHFNVPAFRYNAMVRVGYSNLNLFATYALNPLFRSGAGPELYQFSAGITVVGW